MSGHGGTGVRPLEQGLVLDLRFNEGVGLVAHDVSGQRNHGAIIGASWENGMYGKCLSFDGIDDYVTTPNSSLSSSEGTWIVWLKDTGSISWADYVCLYFNSTNFLHLQYHSNGNVYLGSMYGGVSQNISPNDGLTDVEDELWHQVGITFSESSNRRELYFDGESILGFDGWSSFTVPTNLYIGSESPSTRRIKAYIDELRIYNHALVLEEIKLLLTQRGRI